MLICVNVFLGIYSSIYYRLFQYLSSLIPVSTEGHGRYYYTPLQAILMGVQGVGSKLRRKTETETETVRSK